MILLRHTRPAVATGVCYGRTELALAAPGTDIPNALAVVGRVAAVYSSPSARCRELAGQLAARDGVPLIPDSRLCELDFGRWEGRRWNDIPRAAIDAWAADPWGYAPGDGETLSDLWLRVAQFRTEIGDDAAPIAVVSHHGPLRVLAAQIHGRDWRSIWKFSFGFGECLVLPADQRLFEPSALAS